MTTSPPRRNAAFVLGHLRGPGEGWRLLRSYKDGQARFNAYLEDYAFYADGLLALYEATFDPRWFERGEGLAQTTVEQFADEEGGGFFDTSADHETLLTRPKDLYDNATPAGNSVAVDVLLPTRRVHRRRGVPGASGALPLRPGGVRRAASGDLRAPALRAGLRHRPGAGGGPGGRPGGPDTRGLWRRSTPATIPTGCWRCACLGRRGIPRRGDPAPGGADGDRGPGDGLRLPALRLSPPVTTPEDYSGNWTTSWAASWGLRRPGLPSGAAVEQGQPGQTGPACAAQHAVAHDQGVVLVEEGHICRQVGHVRGLPVPVA